MSDRPSGEAIHVAFVDDDTVIRAGTPLLLAVGFVSVGAFASVEGFLAVAPAAEVIVLALMLTSTGARGVAQGAAAIRAATAAGYPILIYTNERRRLVLAGCLAAGAWGVVHKAEPVAELQAAIRAVLAGEVVVTTALTGLAEVVDRYGELLTLSLRQREVLSRWARGEPLQLIASRLGISRRMAEEYMAEVSRRFAGYLQDDSAAHLKYPLGVNRQNLT